MIRVTADSNIFISAFLRGGKPLELLEMARAGQVELSVTEHLLTEVERVLRTKFRVGDEDAQEFRHEICSFATLVVPSETIDAVSADPTDNRILRPSIRIWLWTNGATVAFAPTSSRRSTPAGHRWC